MKLTDYVVDFLEKKGIHDFFGYQGTMIAHLVDSIEMPEVIPVITSRELLLRPAAMLRRRMPAVAPMLQAARERPICFLVWQMLILIHFR